MIENIYIEAVNNLHILPESSSTEATHSNTTDHTFISGSSSSNNVDDKGGGMGTITQRPATAGNRMKSELWLIKDLLRDMWHVHYDKLKGSACDEILPTVSCYWNEWLIVLLLLLLILLLLILLLNK